MSTRTPSQIPAAEAWYRNTLLAIAGCGVLLQMAALGPLRNSFWGFHLFAFTPVFLAPVAWAVVVIAALGLRSPFGSSADRPLAALGRHPVVSTAVVAAVLTALFWILRSQQRILGDALPLTVDLPMGVSYHPRQPLAMWLQQALYSATGSWFGKDLDAAAVAHRTVALGSVAAGCVFVVIASALGRALSRAREHSAAEPWLITFVLLTQGYAILFFGYVENYAYHAVAIALYLLLSVWYLRRRVPLSAVAVALVLCTGLHLSTLMLFPGFLYLVARGLRRKEQRRDAVIGTAVLVLALVGLDATIRAMSPDERLFASAGRVLGVARDAHGGGAGPGYMFSGSHFRDFFNEHFLAGPFAAFLFLPAAIFALRQRRWRDPVTVFLGLCAAFYLAGSWAMSEPLLGYARDWDLFAPAAVCYATAGVYMLVQHTAKTGAATRLLRFALIFSVMCLVPWVWINHSPERSVERMKTLPLGGGRAEVVVGNYYLRSGEPDSAQVWFRRALRKAPGNINAIALLATLHAERGDYARAAVFMARAVELRPDKAQYRTNLVQALLETGRCSDARPHLLWLARHTPGRLKYWQGLGDTLLRLECGDMLPDIYAPVLAHVAEYVQTHPDDESYLINGGIFLGKLGRLDESLWYFQRCLEAYPDSPAALFNVGVTLERLGRGEEARPLLERFLRLYPDHPLAAAARDIVG